ncbi:trypsin-like serine protease [Pseudomonas sp. NW5]|uniref:trypsin-like serine protease n=1 Tax=Pseudomonas sp. NW5 TaxID=2934934 RepID=UPI002020A4E7|nr:trypsin-like serine protease [Pseudomonas sp. NW5]MCL7462286.1 trypsin-like serine protease [Pseudomonas sp. NW5]
MVATTLSYTDTRYKASAELGYGGVVRVSAGGYYGTGVLLLDGRAVLTAAHLLQGYTSAKVSFETTVGSSSLTSSNFTLHPRYDNINLNNDLALIWLPQAAPVAAVRHDLYRESDEVGQAFQLIGYGVPGTGSTGIDASYTGSPMRLRAINRFEAEIDALDAAIGLSWQPLAGSQLLADFDSGQVTNDAFGQLLGLRDMGFGLSEGSITTGDSGGPAFIGTQVAGIASYITTVSRGLAHPDIDTTFNSSFGELASWQRVSYYQQWIDQSQRAQYRDAPTRPEEVKTSLAEGNIGTQLTYFLLQFTGVRSDPQQWLSVDYVTRDGTAVAGEDYLAVSGTLVLYPGENQAVIAVEIIGDSRREPDEVFYLDVFNPIGGSFGEGVVKLSAMRTLLNDDLFA